MIFVKGITRIDFLRPVSKRETQGVPPVKKVFAGPNAKNKGPSFQEILEQKMAEANKT